jgi:hypothetical protein
MCKKHITREGSIMSQQELLAILDLGPEATWTEVQKTYRELIAQWNPERFADDERKFSQAEYFTKQYNKAFDGLLSIHCRGAWPVPQARPADFGKKREEEVPTAAENQEIDAWRMEIGGLALDVEIVSVALAFSCVLFLPIFMMMQEIGATGGISAFAPLYSSATAMADFGLNAVLTAGGAIAAFVATV